MKRKSRSPSARTDRRLAARAADKLQQARERLFSLEAGGTPERPIELASAAVVEIHALSLPCPRCEGAHQLVEHAAVTVRAVRLREVRLRCRQCGSARSVWFRLIGESVN